MHVMQTSARMNALVRHLEVLESASGRILVVHFAEPIIPDLGAEVNHLIGERVSTSPLTAKAMMPLAVSYRQTRGPGSSSAYFPNNPRTISSSTEDSISRMMITWALGRGHSRRQVLPAPMWVWRHGLCHRSCILVLWAHHVAFVVDRDHVALAEGFLDELAVLGEVFDAAKLRDNLYRDPTGTPAHTSQETYSGSERGEVTGPNDLSCFIWETK